MTINKKYDQKRTDKAGAGRIERKGPRKNSVYKTERTGRIDKKKVFRKDEKSERSFKSYAHKRNEEFDKDKARPGRSKPFSREGTEKSYDSFNKRSKRPYTSHSNQRNEEFDKDKARPGRSKPFSREGTGKNYDTFTKRNKSPYTSHSSQRNEEFDKDKARPGRSKPFSREGTAKKYDRFSEKGQRPYTPHNNNRNEGFDNDRFQTRKDKPYGRKRIESKYNKFAEKDRKERKPFETRRPGISTQAKPKYDGDKIRLNRYISTSGICSRREADDLISAGLITVNGKLVNELGSKVSLNDEVRYNGELIKKERNVYILLNKPKEFITTSKDPYAKHTVLDLIKGACKERVFPVGRLDRNTTGVLLLTNDGELTKKLTHPSFNKKKIYHVFLDKNLKASDLETISNGIDLDDGFIKVDDISFVTADDKKQVGLEIHSGRNHIVRRIFEYLGYRVIRLDRVYFAGLTKKGLQRGHWRFLTDQEIGMLKMGSYK